MRLKILIVTLTILAAVSGGVALREYLLLKRIEASFMKGPAETTPPAGSTTAAATPAKARLVDSVTQQNEGRQVTARVNFAAFKKMVEQDPDVIRRWGRFGWKVLGNTPALCIRSLSATNPLAALGAAVGDCVTHLDGETVNQPMRNLAIWLSLGGRESLDVILLRRGQRISYLLRRI